MHFDNLEQWQHSHNFLSDHHQGEQKTKIVLILTFVTMVAEIVAGLIFGSMALLADGWHMATHLGAFAITVFAYQYARTHANNPQYTFGTGKVSILGGFTSAIILLIIALLMIWESLHRLWETQFIQFDQAIFVAIIGLIVNVVSVFILENHEHHHEHHHDVNLKAAYFHVLADALTSILAIVALSAGKYLGWWMLDPLIGIVGAIVIMKWAYGLIKDTSTILLDGVVDKQTKLAIIEAIEEVEDNRIADLHIWNISQNHLSVTISLVTNDPQPPNYYKNLLKDIPSIAHLTIEVNPCHQ